jgi:tetratricopeptide (TPR) repeat protein
MILAATMLWAAGLLPSALKLPSLDLASKLPALDIARQLTAYGDAASVCAGVLAQPDDSEGWRRLGKLLHGKGRLRAARFALARAADLNSDDASLQLDLANAQRSIGSFGESTEALLAAASISGKRDQSLCYYRAPTSDEAAEAPPAASRALSRAIGSDNDDPVWLTRLASAEECAWVIRTSEAFNAARGGWGNPPPRYAPAGTVGDDVRAPHMLVADCPELLDWWNGKLASTVWPTLAAQFGDDVAAEMWLYDAFLLKFDGVPGRSGLGMHVDDDGLGLSLNLLLADPEDFEGGGTYFEDGERTITPCQGELVSHHGGLRHASVPTTGGLRYILVAFLRAPSLAAEPPDYVVDYCAPSRAEVVAHLQARGSA